MNNEVTKAFIEIQNKAADRALTIETAVAGLVGNLEVIAGTVSPEPGQSKETHAVFALSHAVILAGNVAAALNEISASMQMISILVSADYDEGNGKSPAATSYEGRDFLGKKKN